MKFSLYEKVRNTLERYNPSHRGREVETLLMPTINLRVDIHNYNNFLSFKTIKDECNVGIVSFDDPRNQKARTDSEKIKSFKEFLGKAIGIAKLETVSLKSFNIQRKTGTKLEEIKNGKFKITINSSIGLNFSHVWVYEKEIWLRLSGNKVKVFHGDEAKKVLEACAKFKDLELMYRKENEK